MPESGGLGDLNNPKTWKESGNEYFKKGQFEEAAKSYEYALKLNPEYLEAWNNLGLAYIKLGRLDEARKCNTRVNEIKSKEKGIINIPQKSKNENEDRSSPVVSSQKIPWALIIIFVISIFVALNYELFDLIFFFFIVLLGGLSIYFLIKKETARYKYIDYLGIFYVILGILYFVAGIFYDTSTRAIINRITYAPPGLGGMVFAIQKAHDLAYKEGLLLIGLIIVVFGLLICWEIKKRIDSPKKERKSLIDLDKNKKNIAAVGIAVLIFILLASVGAYFGAESAKLRNGDSANDPNITVVTTTNPMVTTNVQQIQSQISTNCNILGKWIQKDYQGTPVSGVYFQIYSDKRIEIYVDSQLRSWGTYEIISPDQVSNTWTGGKDTGTNTFTLSPDCQTLYVVSFRGERSTFIRG